MLTKSEHSLFINVRNIFGLISVELCSNVGSKCSG